MNNFIQSFELNFIKDRRYMYLVEGLGNTLLITFFAVILGVLLGFLIAVVRSTHDKTGRMKFLNALCKLYLAVIRELPPCCSFSFGFM